MYDPRYHRWNKKEEAPARMFSTPAATKSIPILSNRYSQVRRNTSYIYSFSLKY
jgi:hypothetical protein